MTIDEHTDKRQRARELMLRRLPAERAAADRIKRTPRAGRLPLSRQQEGLWSLQQTAPEATTYHIPLVLRLRGRLDLAALRTALAGLAERHEGLRTRFIADDTGPQQVIESPGPVPVEVADLSGPGAENRARAAVADVLARPFDLAAAPAVRCWVGRLGPQEHVFVLVLHHILVDGWSMGILVGELTLAYEAALDGRLAPLPKPDLQPADHAAWQRDALAGGRLAKQVDYWRDQLADAPMLDLPSSFPRPAMPTGAGEGFTWQLPPELGRKIRELAADENTSLLSVLLSGLLVVLRRQTGQDDIVVGSLFSGRTQPQLESMVGYLAVTSVLRTDTGGDPTFRELLGRATNTVFGALGHQDVPFPVLVDELKPERVPGRNPIFQVSLSFAPATVTTAGFGLPGLQVEPFPYSVPDSRFDLRLEVIDRPDGGFDGYTEFSTELFTRGRVERLVAQLPTVLTEAMEDPDTRLSAYRVLPAEEWDRVVTAPNRTRVDWQNPRDVPQFIADWAVATRDAVAIRCGTDQLTYGELNRRSAYLAALLRGRHGICRDVLVGICARRSLDLMVGLLAIWKSGGAYTPLDPDLPAARIHGMARQAGVPVVLAQRDLLDAAPPGIPTVTLDNLGSSAPEELDDAIADDAELERLAYVMFTSGSTGAPKGVMIDHRGLVNRLHWMQAEHPIGPGDIIVQKTPFSFDISVWEMFWPLMAGATLVMARPDGHRDSVYLADLMASEEVTNAHFVPSMLRRFLEVDPLPPLPALRRVFCSGEALPAGVARKFAERLPSVELHNLYGPTEASIEVTAWPVPFGFAGTAVPIGRSIANISCYVLDADLNPSALGVPGQLFLAGVGLARGYLGRPDLTADRFLPCPYGPPGERMYATGDVVAWTEAGELDYLGRNDRQIKIRGLRIELPEIEHVLAGHPAVAAAAVVATADPAGEPQLAGYLVPADPANPDELADASVRLYLADRLPIHMIPTFLITLLELPTTRNGKLDVAALPPLLNAAGGGVGSRELTDTEAVMAVLWRVVLSLPEDHPLHPEDSFFSLGGNSLYAAQLAAQLQNSYDLDLGIRLIYLSPTLEGLTVAVENTLLEGLVEAASGTGSEDRGSSLVPVRTGGQHRPFFAVHAAAGSAAPFLGLAPLLDEQLPVYAFQAPEIAGGEPVGSLHELADHYVELVRGIQPTGPYRLGGWSLGGVVALEMAARLRAAGLEVERLVLLDSWVPPPLADLPDHAGLLAAFCSDAATIRGAVTPSLDLAALRGLADEDQVDAVLAALAGAGLIKAGLVDEIRPPLQAFLTNIRAYHGHQLSTYDQPVTLVLARDDDSWDDHDHKQLAQWRLHVNAGLDVRVVPGTHYTMLEPPYAAELARTLCSCLDPGVG